VKDSVATRRSRFASGSALLLVLFLVGGVYSAFASPKVKADEAANQSIAVKEGRQLYLQGCSTCHGLNAEGLSGPTLIGVGSASVVFQVESGRMPLANGAAQAPRKKVKYDRTQIDQLAAYIQSLGGGPEAPTDAQLQMVKDGDLALGGDLFRTNCSSCHNFAGAGGALTRGSSGPPWRPARRTCRASATTRCRRRRRPTSPSTCASSRRRTRTRAVPPSATTAPSRRVS
jgi:ubiquinol-cytochrome c reductase cytochrome c subunit